MADLAAILAAVVNTIETVSPGLTVTDFYRDSLAIGVGGLVEVGPASDEGATNAEHHHTTGDAMDYLLTVTLYLATVAEEAAQRRMYAFMSRGNELSVWDVLDAAHAVTGVYEKLLVQRSHSYVNRERSGGGRLLTNSWDLIAVAV